jgi:sodium-dependent phosphate cotransporter
MNSVTENKIEKNQLMDLTFRFISVVLLLYFFLVGVKLLGGSFKMMGSGFATSLLDVTHNPILALFSGMLATVLIQSSSVTTSIIVGLVASGTLPLGGAIPMVMGANLGTSVTNSLVSLGYLKNKQHFKKAFAAATIHDFFNILTVLIMLPLELATGFLENSATALAAALYGNASGVTYSSPIKASIKPVAKAVQVFVTETLGFQSTLGGIVMMVISFVFIIFALTMIVKIMKVLIESNKGEIIENLLSKNGYVSIFFGMLLTIAVQSSSITTSLLVPMAGAGALSLRSILPVTIGANIGTTATALLAALTGNVTGLAIALVHLLFNVAGLLIWFVHPKMREIPLKLCEGLANLTLRNRFNGLAYVLCVFFIIPLLLILIL